MSSSALSHSYLWSARIAFPHARIALREDDSPISRALFFESKRLRSSFATAERSMAADYPRWTSASALTPSGAEETQRERSHASPVDAPSSGVHVAGAWPRAGASRRARMTDRRRGGSPTNLRPRPRTRQLRKPAPVTPRPPEFSFADADSFGGRSRGGLLPWKRSGAGRP